MEILSSFKSAIYWPEFTGEEQPTGELISFGSALADALDGAAESFAMAGNTESPIETIFGARISFHLRRFCSHLGWSFAVGVDQADILLLPQYPIGRFRYDFALLVRGVPEIVIECDGKEFHSTDSQIANDRFKDYLAKDAGIEILRFTGSELNRDADRCVRVALGMLFERLRNN